MKKLLWLSLVGVNSLIVADSYAQTMSMPKAKNNGMVISAQLGENFVFDSHLPGIACDHCPNAGMYLKKYINDQLAIESGISYSNNLSGSNNKYRGVAIPVTAQYYMPVHSKIHPYIGAGAVYTSSETTNQQNNGYTDNAAKAVIKKETAASVMVEQGTTYDISTRIQIKEAIHFIPKTATCGNTIGFNLGIGYRL